MPLPDTTFELLCKTSQRRRNLLGGLVLLTAGLVAAPSLATELRVVTSDDGEATRQILTAFARQVVGFHASADVHLLASRKGPGIYIAVGPGALRAVLEENPPAPVLSIFTSREAYTRIVSESDRSGRHSPITAIFAEAAPQNQMQLVQAIFGRRVVVGVLLTSGTLYMEQILRDAAKAAKVELDVQALAPGENVIRALARVRSSTVVLAIPDRELYTAEVFRDILEVTYRRNQPVIGFTPALVKAGTLATAYSTVEDTLAQLTQITESIISGKVPEPQYPQYWRVAFNDNVARSLNVVISDSARTLGVNPP